MSVRLAKYIEKCQMLVMWINEDSNKFLMGVETDTITLADNVAPSPKTEYLQQSYSSNYCKKLLPCIPWDICTCVHSTNSKQLGPTQCPSTGEVMNALCSQIDCSTAMRMNGLQQYTTTWINFRKKCSKWLCNMPPIKLKTKHKTKQYCI